MSWKKNVFSYLLWVFYAVTAEVGLVCLADAACDFAGVEIYIGTVACALYIITVGLGVLLIHRFVAKHSGTDGRKHSAGRAAEAAAVVLLLVTGLVLRVRGMETAGAENLYYELAVMVSGENIPRFAHGAVGLYIQLLHGLFYFLGNKPAVAAGAQLFLQMGAMLLLYLAVRRLAGRLAAVVMLGFGMLSSYLPEEAYRLSPAMLYLFLWAAALLLAVRAVTAKKGMWKSVLAGLVIAFTGYLDVAGWLLLLISAAAVFCEKEEPEKGRRGIRLLLFLLSAGAGFAGCVLADSLLCGMAFTEVLSGWLQLYSPQGFRLPVSAAVPGTMAEAVAEYIVLFCVLTLGIFSFWRNRQRDYRKGWILLLTVLLPAGCFGIFTEEIPMGLYLYLVLIIMAGIAVEECVRKAKPASGPTAPLPAEGAVMPAESEGAAGPSQKPQPGSELAPQPEKMQEDMPQPGGGTAPQPGDEPTAATEPVKVKLIENPLPLPKKHVKRTLDYGVAVPAGKDDFDLEVDEKDDFDI
ncbi:MAG: hypothetical protein NC123_06855 [Butyrivibrio sp.]|nr:hypothetical protein [Acetatifactor muris]MCM1559247.1 hypothetical protein [Butyrivibrio sp.]